MTKETPSKVPVEAQKQHADFDDHWVPGEYLRDYYSEIEPDEIETIRFFVDTMKDTPANGPILFFGTGPTLHHVFLAAPKASELHIVDYLDPNLAEIKKWQEGKEGAHDWKPFVTYTLQCEGTLFPTDEDIQDREKMVRQKMTLFMHGNADHENPLGVENREKYSLVFSPYCADSATADKDTWKKYMRNITSLVKPGGKFITAALRDCESYDVGGKKFPSANINEVDMKDILQKLDFPAKLSNIEYRELEGHGYSGIILAHARKNSSK